MGATPRVIHDECGQPWAEHGGGFVCSSERRNKAGTGAFPRVGVFYICPKPDTERQR